VPSSSNVIGPVLSQGKPVMYQTRTRSWTNTAGYWTKPKSELPINDYTDDQLRYEQFLGTRSSRNRTTGVVTTTYIGYSTTLNLVQKHQDLSNWLGYNPSDATLVNQAAIKALGKLADAKVNLAVSLAEASKTSSLILGTAERLYRAYRAFRRGDLQRVARELNISPKKLHRSWLEYKYGWMPLLMDVKGAAELLAQHHVGRPPWVVGTGTAQDEDSDSRHVLDSTYSSGSSYDESARRTRLVKVRIECEITNPLSSSIQQMGLTNPALVVWELVPFSFVFDWFVSVGNYLQAVTALHGLTVRRAFVSRLAETWTEYASHALGYTTATVVDSGYEFTFKGHGRSYIRDQYVVDLTSLYPPVNPDPFNWGRLITGLALVRAKAGRL